MIWVEREDAVAKFIMERRMPGHRFVPPYSGFVVHDDGAPIGAYALNCYTGHDVALSGVIIRPWPIKVAREIARQCFVGLGTSRITAWTRVSNERAIKSLLACGFNSESIARDHFGDEDANVLVLLRRDQKLLRI